jgi:hypothetical protein
MNFSLNPTQFGELKAALASAQGVSLVMDSPVEGRLTTPDVTLQCVYDGSANLSVAVVQRRSFKARIAPESMIEDEITKMFTAYIAQIG